MGLFPAKQTRIETVDVPVETGLAIVQPNTLTVVPQKFSPQAGQCCGGNIVCNQRNFIQFEVGISRSGGAQQRTDDCGYVRLRQCGIEQEIAAILDVTEVNAERTSVYNDGSDRFFVESAIRQPDLTRATQANGAVQIINSLQFQIAPEFFSNDVDRAAYHHSQRA